MIIANRSIHIMTLFRIMPLAYCLKTIDMTEFFQIL